MCIVFILRRDDRRSRIINPPCKVTFLTISISSLSLTFVLTDLLDAGNSWLRGPAVSRIICIFTLDPLALLDLPTGSIQPIMPQSVLPYRLHRFHILLLSQRLLHTARSCHLLWALLTPGSPSCPVRGFLCIWFVDAMYKVLVA